MSDQRTISEILADCEKPFPCTAGEILAEMMGRLHEEDALMRGVAKRDLAHIGAIKYDPLAPRYDYCSGCDTPFVFSETNRFCSACSDVIKTFEEYPSMVFHTPVHVKGKFYIISRCYIDDIGDQLS